MSKILFLTNVIRRMGMMQQALEKVQNAGRLPGDSACWWVTDTTEWTKENAERLKGTDFLMLKWMGSGLTTTFLKKVKEYAQKHKIPYYIDAAGGDDADLIGGLTAEQEKTITLYTIYGGEKNLYNLWQYMDSVVTGQTSDIEKPNPVHWAGIFHPDAKKVYTELAEYEKDFCQPGRRTLGFMFYRDEWVWGDLEYQSLMVREIEKQGMNVICVFSNGMPNKELGMPSLPEVPKNSNIGSGLGLDTVESIRRLLVNMQERGYKVDFIPKDGKEFIELLTRHATNDRSMLNDRQLAEANKITGKEYGDFYHTFEQPVQEQLKKDWDEAPGHVMEYDGRLLVPGTMDGNVFITVQPPRGFGEDPSKIYHSPFCAPTHQYIAFYQWIRDIWKADAVIHVGTHGSLEWLPGKNAGLSAACYPDLTLRELPDLYIYNITITGEGIQAKRRGAAVLDEHLPAPQSQAGTYEELEELEKLMDEYVHFQRTEPDNLPRLAEMVLAKAKEANLDNEVTYDESKPFDDYLTELHNYICDLKNLEVHTGLHILGEPPLEDGLTEYLWLLTRLDNGAIPSLNQTLAGQYGYDYYYLLENSSLIYEPLNLTFNMLIDKIGSQCREVIRILQDHDFAEEGIAQVLRQPWVQEAAKQAPAQIQIGASRTGQDAATQAEPLSFLERLEMVCGYICHTIYPNLMLTTDEQKTLIRGLEGEYIWPGPSGAPSSGGADLLPTGRNFYGVDPRTLPTKAAWGLGQDLGDQVISRFIEEEGHYPENIGIILWSGANMRSHGQCIAEFLYLLGVKPIWQPGSLRVTGLEVIPLEELKRPRIDVTARISGLFRDAMPCAAELLDKAVLKVGALEEDPELNFVRKHILEDSAELEKEEGMSKEEAWRTAAFRIFGDEQGVYGAGVSALLEAKNWETIDDLADVYVRWGAHAYGGKTKGKYLPNQFRKRMGSLDITIKNEDNHETNMFSSDDYNAYHGGMIAAVRSIKGSAPKSYCGDSSDRSRVTMHSVQEQAKRIFRSESINPTYIEGMMKHGYKGAADMSNMVAHSFQWDATSKVMEDWMYEKYAEKYVLDPKVQEWMREVNPWALKRTAEILLEASQRELWNAREETLQQLQKLCLDVDGELEEKADEA